MKKLILFGISYLLVFPPLPSHATTYNFYFGGTDSVRTTPDIQYDDSAIEQEPVATETIRNSLNPQKNKEVVRVDEEDKTVVTTFNEWMTETHEKVKSNFSNLNE